MKKKLLITTLAALTVLLLTALLTVTPGAAEAVYTYELGDFVVSTNTENGVTYVDGVLAVKAGGEYTVSMKSGVTKTADCIAVETDTGVTLTLDGVNIQAAENYAFALMLATGCNVTLKTTDAGARLVGQLHGIYNSGDLTFDTGRMIAEGGENGIYNDNASTLRVTGGEVTSEATAYNGKGMNNHGTITVSGTAVVHATGETGGGIHNQNNGTLNVTGGELTAKHP